MLFDGLEVEQFLGLQGPEQRFEPCAIAFAKQPLVTDRLPQVARMVLQLCRRIAEQRRQGSQRHLHVGISICGWRGVRLAPPNRLTLFDPCVGSLKPKPDAPRST